MDTEAVNGHLLLVLVDQRLKMSLRFSKNIVQAGWEAQRSIVFCLLYLSTTAPYMTQLLPTLKDVLGKVMASFFI